MSAHLQAPDPTGVSSSGGGGSSDPVPPTATAAAPPSSSSSSSSSQQLQSSSSGSLFQWPNRREDYELLDVIGSGATSVVQVARCIPNNQKVAVKRIDLERCGSSIEELQKEITLMSNCNHPNVINYYTSFVVKHELWLVMKLMSGGSLLDIVKHVLAKGGKGGVLDEVVIATILKEVLLGLEYFHGNKQIHRDLKAGNILIGNDGSVQLADFGVSNWLYDTAQRDQYLGSKAAKRMPRNTFVGTPCWMAPEVMDQSMGYNEKADIWSLGITALELATGTAPYAKFPPMKVLMLTLENPPPTLETCGDLNGKDYLKHYSKSFQKLVEKCLQRDPDKRPSATELLKMPFIKKAKNKEFIKEIVLGDAPSLQSRAKKVPEEVARKPGASGHLRKTEDGGWIWSDDEEASKEEEREGDSKKKVEETTKSSESSTGTTAEPTPPPAVGSTGMVPLAVPNIQVQPDSTPATIPAIASLQQQILSIQSQLHQVEQQLLLAKQQREQIALMQQTAQQTPEQIMQARKLLESVQNLERQKQMLEFQKQQVLLSLQQAQDAQAMERQFQEALKLQQQQGQQSQGLQQRQQPVAEGKPQPGGRGIKLVLRKRTEQNQLKDIKFDFIPGSDTPDAIAKDLIAAGLIDGRNLVVMAANIQKIVENPTLEKVVFQIVSDVSPAKLDEKNLVGFAQLSVFQDA